MQIEPLRPSDVPRVARVATQAFAGHAFYRDVVGLTDAQFARYWRAFFRLSAADPGAMVIAAYDGDRLVGAIAMAFDGFPRAGRTVGFLATLLVRLGPAAWLRYTRFVLRYLRAMHRPRADRRREGCGLWLFVDPACRTAGVGAALITAVIDVAYRRAGKTLYTGFVDASDARLLAFYRRLGFTVSPPFDVGGRPAARIARDRLREAS